MGIAAFFGMFAGVYHWFPKMFGRFMNNTMGFIHFWITMLGSYCIFWPMHYMGLTGLPRRYYTHGAFQTFSQYTGMNEFMTVAAFIVFFAQLIFVFNFFYSIFKGRRMTTLNPWGSNTIEWTTPIIPDMATGRARYPLFTVGPTITAKMV